MANEVSKLIDRTIMEVDLSTGITEVGQSAFYNCKFIDRMVFGPNITRIGTWGTYNVRPTEIVWNSINATADGGWYWLSDNLKRLTFGEGVQTCPFFLQQSGNYYGAPKLLEVTYPTTMRSLVSYALQGCSNLTSISCWAATPPTLGYSTFDYTNDCPIYVPATSVDAYKAAAGWTTYASRITGVAEGNTNWVKTTYSCEIDPQTGKMTGNAQVVEMDNNPTSATHGQTRTVTVQNFGLCQARFEQVTDVSQITSGKYLIADDDYALNASLIASTTSASNGINNRRGAGNKIEVASYNNSNIVADAKTINAAMYYDAVNKKLSWTDETTGTTYYLQAGGYTANIPNFKYTDTTTMPVEDITPASVRVDNFDAITFVGTYNSNTTYLKKLSIPYGWSSSFTSYSNDFHIYKLIE